MANPNKTEHTTYASLDDILTICPDIDNFVKPYIDDETEAKAYIARCLKLATVWINNQLEQSERNTFASSNEKELIEANYATFLILRGVLRGKQSENNQWLFSYRDEAEKLMQHLIDKATERPGQSTRTKRFRKNRILFPDFGNDEFPFGVHSHFSGD